MEQNPIEKNYKSFNTEVSDERKTVVLEDEIVRLSPDEIPNKLFEIGSKKMQDHLKNSFDPEDKFILRDKISLINHLDVGVGGAKEYELNFVIKGLLKDLENNYKEILVQKTKEINLGGDQLYNIHDWAQELLVYSKVEKEEEINEETLLKSSYDSKIVTQDKPRF